MKRWPGILLLFFAALLWGCGGSHDARITAVLDRADSLLLTGDATMHDSVRQELEALDTARALQSDEMLRARHALLLVQARYKCYVTIPADSALIDTAYRYYADHHSSSADHERYTRTLIYQGAVAEELGHPQQAMQWYLEAEQAADPNDHFNLGFTNLRMALIHHEYHLSDSIDLQRYCDASKHFSMAESSHYQLICLTEIGTIFSANNLDSAKHYISQALELAKNDPDSFFLATNYINLSGAYFNFNKFPEARNCAFKALNCGYEPTATEIPKCLMLLSRSYAALGMTDSAQYYADRVVNVKSPADSVNYYCMMADIAKHKGDSAKYYQYYSKGTDVILNTDSLSPYYDIQITEKRFNENLKKIALGKEKTQKIIFLLLSSLLVIAIFFTIVHFRKQIKRKNTESHTALLQIKQELERTKNEMASEKLRIEQEVSHQFTILNERLKEAQQNQKDTKHKEQQISDNSISVLSSVVEHQLSVMNSLVEHSYHYEHNPKRFLNEFTNTVSAQTIDDNFFKSLREYVAVKYGINFNALQTQYGLKEDELTVISLSCCNIPTTVIMVCMGYHHLKSVDNKKQKIKKKIGVGSYRSFIESLRSGL